MKNVRFYLEHETNVKKRKNEHDGNVFAAFIEPGTSGLRYDSYADGKAVYDGIGAVFFHPNSHVASTSSSLNHIRNKCKRISEAKAREIHPNLFQLLDVE